jgi:hypothetical protein
MSDLYQTSADLRAATQDLARQERPAAALTLTRTNTLSITTAGTIITWESATRTNGFTWSGADVTVPTAGYYLLTVIYASASTTAYANLLVNSVVVDQVPASYITSTLHTFIIMRYYATGDVINFRVFPSANTTITVVAENSAGESPILHIVQLTGAVS